VREGVSNLFSSPLPALFAGLAITLAVLAFNILGDALRDYLDPDRMTR
jgi:ABC-type dipeptide/oligopeptide/nickel transport system permease subunit